MDKVILDCPCQKNETTSSENVLDILEEFGNIRKQCPALKKILLPDDTWESFQKENLSYDKAAHQSILLLAYRRGALSRITMPIHKYLMAGNKPLTNLNKNYIKDLRERWMEQSNELDRHKKTTIFQGKMVEPLIADWLEQQGWKIDNLEATGAQHDIECVNPTGYQISVEVKYIGEHNSEFEKIMGSKANGNPNMYKFVNYVTYRGYEASRQLIDSCSRKLAIIVIGHQSLQRLKLWPLRGKWIDLKTPRFYLEECGTDWFDSLHTSEDYETVVKNLSLVFNSLSELWIVAEQENLTYELVLKHIFESI